MVACGEIALRTRQRCQMLDITGELQRLVAASGIGAGSCTAMSLHTTAGITVNENADPDVVADILDKLESLVPRSAGFRHAEGNSDSHIKASLVGISVHVPVRNGKLVLGTWQSVYFCEFDGPRSRKVAVTVVGEKEPSCE